MKKVAKVAQIKKSSVNKKTVKDRNIGVFQKDSDISTIYIGNLRYSKTEQDLKKLFENYGKVTYVKLMLDTKTFKSKGYAFIQMNNKIHATKAIESLNGKQMDGRTLKVSLAQESNSTTSLKRPSQIEKKEAPEKTEITKKAPKQGLGVLFSYLKK